MCHLAKALKGIFNVVLIYRKFLSKVGILRAPDYVLRCKFHPKNSYDCTCWIIASIF